MKSDYRNSKYCQLLSDVSKKKKKLSEKIIKAKPRVKIIYTEVRNNRGPYKKEFMKIYNYKCAYCGNSTENANVILFEIDHYISEVYFKEDKAAAGRMENLVLACYDCNRAKSNFKITNEYKSKLNPDYEEITDIFHRDENYYIQISENYKKDPIIKNFYESLKLGKETRRLDFLLLNIRGLCKSKEGELHVDKLNSILVRLAEKRNLSIC